MTVVTRSQCKKYLKRKRKQRALEKKCKLFKKAEEYWVTCYSTSNEQALSNIGRPRITDFISFRDIKDVKEFMPYFRNRLQSTILFKLRVNFWRKNTLMNLAFYWHQ